MALRFDVGEVKGATVTPQGGLRVPATLTRVGVLTYRDASGKSWGELRPADEVFRADSLASLRGAPVTLGHPDHMVTANTWRADAIGHACDDVRADGAFVAATLVVQDAAAVGGVDARALREISCGYECDIEATPGVYEGQRYDAVQRNIRYNHAALLPPGGGRAGPEVALRLDGAAVQVASPPSTASSDDRFAPRQPSLFGPRSGRQLRADGREEFEMRSTLKVGKQEFKTDAGGMDAAQSAIEASQAAMDTLAGQRDALQKALDETKAKVAQLETALAAANAAADTAKAAAAAPPTPDMIPPAVLDAAVAKRTALLESARKVLGTETKFDGKDASAIKRDVIAKVMPTLKHEIKADALDGVYDVAMATFAALPQGEKRNDALGAANAAAIGADENGKPRADADDEDPHTKMVKAREAQRANAMKGSR